MYLLGLLGLLGFARIRAFECSFQPSSLHYQASLCTPRHLCRAIGHSCRATSPPRINVAHSSAHARYLAPSSCYRVSLSHTRRPCA